jgi:hypothetical protein
MDSLRQEFSTTITELRAEIQRQRDQITLLQSRPLPPTRPKPALPDPEKFSGQAYKYDTWRPSISAKLRVDGESIGDDIAQFYYVYLNLESHVQAMVLPQLSQAEQSNSWDYTTILDQLARVYDNPNKVQEAEDRLLTLKQGTDTLPAYVAKFERVLYEARGQDWPDVNKISTFRNGLNSTIRGRLAQQLNLPRQYSAFVRVAQQLAGSSSNFSSGSSSRPYHNPGAPQDNHQRNTGEPMDIGFINAIDCYDDDTPPPPPQARSTSPARREQYRQEGRCVRCGAKDHWVADCTVQPYKPGKVTIAALDDDSWSEASSLNSQERATMDRLDWRKRIGA